MFRYPEDDFLDRHSNGKEVEQFVAAVLSKAGFDVVVSDLPVPPRAEVDMGHVEKMIKTEQDLRVKTKSGKTHIVEVKSQWQQVFTNDPKDFPWDTVMVDRKGKFDGKEQKPSFYVKVSCTREKNSLVVNGMFGIPIHRIPFGRWTEGMVPDRKRDREDLCHFVPRFDCITWEDFVDELKALCDDD